MDPDCLKLTIYFGERDRVRGRFLADALSDLYARHQLEVSLVIRGVGGFGVKHHLRTDRLLSLSEDLPLVSVAVDTRPRIQALVDEVERLRFDGLVTLERARMLTGRAGVLQAPKDLESASKLTVYVGRHERRDGKAAYETVVDLLRRAGASGATVLLGVDGTRHGVRQRARFFATNGRVPVMVIGVLDGEKIAELLPDLSRLLEQPLITLERVRVCKRAGERLADPRHVPEADPSGIPIWQKLMVHAGEQARVTGHPLHQELIRRLRQAGASGATTLRGIWGYEGHDVPHGDSFWQLRRRVPMVTVIVDTPGRIQRWFSVIDELTAETGVVTSELVPAFRATGPGIQHGSLELAKFES